MGVPFLVTSDFSVELEGFIHTSHFVTKHFLKIVCKDFSLMIFNIYSLLKTVNFL